MGKRIKYSKNSDFSSKKEVINYLLNVYKKYLEDELDFETTKKWQQFYNFEKIFKKSIEYKIVKQKELKLDKVVNTFLSSFEKQIDKEKLAEIRQKLLPEQNFLSFDNILSSKLEFKKFLEKQTKTKINENMLEIYWKKAKNILKITTLHKKSADKFLFNYLNFEYQKNYGTSLGKLVTNNYSKKHKTRNFANNLTNLNLNKIEEITKNFKNFNYALKKISSLSKKNNWENFYVNISEFDFQNKKILDKQLKNFIPEQYQNIETENEYVKVDVSYESWTGYINMIEFTDKFFNDIISIYKNNSPENFYRKSKFIFDNIFEFLGGNLNFRNEIADFFYENFYQYLHSYKRTGEFFSDSEDMVGIDDFFEGAAKEYFLRSIKFIIKKL